MGYPRSWQEGQECRIEPFPETAEEQWAQLCSGCFPHSLGGRPTTHAKRDKQHHDLLPGTRLQKNPAGSGRRQLASPLNGSF